MVRIRLRRVGRKKQPSYRVVVTDSRSPRDGRYIEIIGFYNPRTEPSTMTIKEDRALHWLSVGAQPSEAVRLILNKLGTWGRYERLKQGESLETLLAEAEAEAAARPEVSPKTSHAAGKKTTRGSAPAGAAVEAVAEVVEEAVEEEIEIAAEEAEEPAEEAEAADEEETEEVETE